MIQKFKPMINRGRQGAAPGTANAAQKILSVARELGIDGMSEMQATTRTIYDALPMDGRTVFNFFQGCNARAFPFTNLSQNKLEVGEAMVIERMTFQVLTAAVPPAVTLITPLGTVGTSYYASDFQFKVANVTTLKPLSLGQVMPPFNKSSRYATHEPFEFLSLLTIPSLQEFVATLTTTDVTVRANLFLKLTLEGLGVIYSPRNTL